MTPERCCPRCDRRVFNRRLPNCEFCGSLLPAELLLSVDEQLAADRDAIERAASRRQLERERADERERRRRARSHWGF